MFLDSSMRYAKEKNDQTFEIDWTDLWDVITIMTVSPYMSDHSLACTGPLMKMYPVLLLENWCQEIDLKSSNLTFMCVITNTLIQVKRGQNWGHYLMLRIENLHNLECFLVMLVLRSKCCHILGETHARYWQEVKHFKTISGRLRFSLYSTLSKSLYCYILLSRIFELVYDSNTFTARVWLFRYMNIWCQ